MSTKIRLARHGRKKNPFYKIVVIDSRKPTRGLCKELLGHYDPLTKNIKLNLESFNKWSQETGAQVSERVKAIVKQYKKTNENT